jgi:hypothetical protein
LDELGHIFGFSPPTIDIYINLLISHITEKLKPEISFPSATCTSALQGTIPGYNVIGSMDFTIHPLRIPLVDEHRFF